MLIHLLYLDLVITFFLSFPLEEKYPISNSGMIINSDKISSKCNYIMILHAVSWDSIDIRQIVIS